MVECADCGETQNCATQLQRERWVFKNHIGHTTYQWREREVAHA